MEDESMNESHDIFILQLSDRLPAQLRETLIQKGFPTYVTSDPVALETSLKTLGKPIVLVLCREGVDPSFADTKRLIGLGNLHKYPLILAGTEVDSYENILNQHFALATCLSAPFSINEILEAVGYAVRSYPKRSAELTAEDPIEELPELPPVVTPLGPIEPEIPLEEHPVYKKSGGAPAAFFAALENLDIAAGALGGALYPHGIQEDLVRQQNLLPQDKAMQDAARTVCTDAGKWARLHLYRSAYILKNILNSLKIGAQDQEQAKAALFLFAHSFAGENAELLRREYFDSRQTSFRRDLCSRVKDSAMAIALEIKAPEVGNLVAVLGRLIGREEAVNDSPQSIMASAIMAADVADRVCFQSGFWNPRRTYSFLKRVKNAQLSDFHPEVMCCIVKFLNEAISGHPQAMLISRAMKHDPKLREKAEAIQNQKITPEEKKVPLVNLMPGMRLSRPVVAYDGREILSSDVKLDHDLIWRLWQLSTVRPLNGPVVIFSKN